MPAYTKLVLAAVSLPLSASLAAADPRPSATRVSDYFSHAPDYASNVSVSLKEMYDTNVYLQNVTAQANLHSMVSILTPAFATDFAASPDLQGTLSYCADINIYHAAASETFARHTGTLKLTGHDGDWGYVLNGGVVMVDGNRNSPVYGITLGAAPAIGGVERMNRRAQIISTSGLTVTHTEGEVLFRPLFTWKQQDFRTIQSSRTGYQNYASRGEYIVGGDLGIKLNANLTSYVSYRVGGQHQDDLLGVTNNYTNDITRRMFGLEGTLAAWIKVNLQVGQDTRRFTAAAVALNDRTKTKLYSNSSITLAPTAEDNITLTYVRYLQPGSSGRNAYEDLNAEIQWRHTLDRQLTAGAGYRVYDGFFEIGNRRDTISFSNVTVACRINHEATVSADFQHLNTRTAQPNGINVSCRDYSRDQFSVTCKLAI